MPDLSYYVKTSNPCQPKSYGFTNQAVWTHNLPGTGANNELATATGEWELLSAYVNNDVVYTCVERNATAVASTGYHLFRTQPSSTTKVLPPRTRKLSKQKRKKLRNYKAQSDDVEVVELTEHPILDVLNITNEDLNGFQIVKATQLFQEIFGRSYWLKEDAQGEPTNGIPTTIRVLRTHYVFPIRNVDGTVSGYMYTNINQANNGSFQKTTATYTVDQVIDFRNISPSDLYAGGTSWLRAAFGKVELGQKFTEYQEWLLNNRARPDSVFIPKTENLSEEEQKRIDKKLNDRMGRTNNGKIVTLDQSGTLIPLNFPPTDLAALEFNSEMTKSVCNAAGVPIPLLQGDATRANMETAKEDHASGAVLPRVKLLEQVINDSLVILYGDDLFLEFDNPVPADKEFELEEVKVSLEKAQIAITAPVATVDEVREMLGLEPLGGDEGGQIVGPPAAPEPEPDDEADADPDPQPDPAADDSDDGSDDQEQPAKAFDVAALLQINTAVASGSLDRATAINVAAKAFGIDQDEARQLIGHKAKPKAKRPTSLPAPAIPTSSKLTPILQKAFKAQEATYLDQIKTKGHPDQIEKSAVDEDGLPKEFIPIDEWDDDLANEVKPVIEITAQTAADQSISSLTKVGASPDVFSVVPPQIEKAVDKASLNFAQSTNATTAKNLNDALGKLRQEIKDGLVEGDAIPEMRKRVQAVFENADKDRANLIAMSETSRAVHEGLRIAAKASGIVSGFKFLVSDDACPICLDLDGKEIGLDEQFVDSDYDDSMLPIHPGCRCTVLELLKPEDGDDDSGDDSDDGDDN